MKQEKSKEEQQKKIEQMRQYALYYYFTPKARQRLGNIKVSRPDRYYTIIDLSIRFARDGHMTSPITDDELKVLLIKMNQGNRDINIQRK